MKVIVLIILVYVFINILVYLIGLIKYSIDKKRKNSEKDFNQQMITMCLRTKSANQCPHDCNRCAWGRRKGQNIVEFRSR